MGGSGGGQSGTVVYPGYISAIQCTWLVGDQTYDVLDNIEIGSSINELLADAVNNSPFTGATAFDGATRITTWETEINVFETLVDALSETTDWAAALGQAVTTIDANWTAPTPAASAEIAAAVTAFEAIQDDRVEETVLPRFQRGMQDIGGVMTSAFTIGQAIIEGMTDRDVANFQGELRTKAFLLKDQLVADSLVKKNIAYTISADQMVKYVGMILGSNESLARLTFDSEFRAMEAERGEAETQLEIDEADAKWALSMFQYGANMLAASGGASVLPPSKIGPTKTQAMIGGAASGAAVGAQSGTWMGVGIGAVIGGFAGYASA